MCDRSSRHPHLASRARTRPHGRAVPFDEHAQGVRDALHELDDLGVGEVRTGAAVDGDHFIPLTQPGPRGFALASDLHGVEKEATVRTVRQKTRAT